MLLNSSKLLSNYITLGGALRLKLKYLEVIGWLDKACEVLSNKSGVNNSELFWKDDLLNSMNQSQYWCHTKWYISWASSWKA